MSFGAFARCLVFGCGRKWPSVQRLPVTPFSGLGSSDLPFEDDTGQDLLLLSALPSRRNLFHQINRLDPTFFGGEFLTG